MLIFADDYVTEKFFYRMSNTVTVVMGGADYEKLAPPHSYVNVLDYPSPRALASYLLELDQDKEKYLSYFWWQDFYHVRPNAVELQGRIDNYAQAMCRLCEKLHTDHAPKLYKDMRSWWTAQSGCGGVRISGTGRKVYMADNQQIGERF